MSYVDYQPEFLSLNGTTRVKVTARAFGKIIDVDVITIEFAEQRRRFAERILAQIGGEDCTDFTVDDIDRELIDLLEKRPDELDQGTGLSVRELRMAHPKLRDPVIDSLLRIGETMNVIAPTKTGKSWLVTNLAISIVTGRFWLDRFATHGGDVLIIDNELHGETSAHRIPKVGEAMGADFEEYADRIQVYNVRGQLRDIFTLGAYFERIEAGRFKVIILDALYRFIPAGTDENDNGAMANVYNAIDAYAKRLNCSFVLVHHSTKGAQGMKSVTDVGAGAGSQSRATDTHLVLRQHKEPGAYVLEAAARSWAPVDPLCLRWRFPLWVPDTALDPTELHGDGKKPKPDKPEWTPETFAARFVTPDPQTKDCILIAAGLEDISGRTAEKLLRAAVAAGQAFQWEFGPKSQHKFSTIEQGAETSAHT